MFIHVTHAKHLDEYKIEVVFNDGRKGIADLAAVLVGSIFEPLKDVSLFSQLRVDEELETVVWPNGADLAPEYIYFQAFKNDPNLQSTFIQWGYIPSSNLNKCFTHS